MIEINGYEEICKEKINLLREIYREGLIAETSYFQLEDIFDEIENYINKADESTSNKIEILLNDELDNPDEKYTIYILSFLIKHYKKTKYLNRILEITLNCKNLDKYTKYSILGQINYIIFSTKNIVSEESIILQAKLYDHVVEEFCKEIGKQDFIPKEERNEKFIVVFTSQLLSIGHGPTKTALDRCYAIIKYLNKKVILINTKELLSDKNSIPMRQAVSANTDNSITRNIEYKDVNIPVYQTKNKMPNIDEYINIISIIKRYKPYLIFTIGDKCIISDICKEIVPTATICLGDTMPVAKSNFIIPFGNLLQRMDDIRIIKTQFTFDLKPQEKNYVREDFNIPEDKFILTVIGARLNLEVDSEFLKMLNDMALEDCFVTFIGNFEFTKEICEKYPDLKENSINMGFQKDILSCIELMDVYINPKRQGGGTSAVESMYKGKPPISIDFGDVASVIGEEFCVIDYEKMKEAIKKYKNDKKFYDIMSRKSLERAKYLINTKKHFVKAYEDIVSNPIFK